MFFIFFLSVDKFSKKIESKLSNMEMIMIESDRVVLRQFLQRAEVRLSTLHRIAGSFLGGAALFVLIPLLMKDSFGELIKAIIQWNIIQKSLEYSGLAVFSALLCPLLCLCMIIVAVFWLYKDLIRFYFPANYPLEFDVKSANGPIEEQKKYHGPLLSIYSLWVGQDDLSVDGHNEAAAAESYLEDQLNKFLLLTKNADQDSNKMRIRAGLPVSCDFEAGGEAKFQINSKSTVLDFLLTRDLLTRQTRLVKILLVRYFKAVVATVVFLLSVTLLKFFIEYFGLASAGEQKNAAMFAFLPIWFIVTASCMQLVVYKVRVFRKFYARVFRNFEMVMGCFHVVILASAWYWLSCIFKEFYVPGYVSIVAGSVTVLSVASLILTMWDWIKKVFELIFKDDGA